jgi:tellurite methyltransferase
MTGREPAGPLPSDEVRSWFGEIDIYLFDQILKGRFDRRRRVLDAGCGDGRNLVYFLRRGFQCFGIDREPSAVARVRALASELAPAVSSENFHVGELDDLPWADEEAWRVLAGDGLLFARLASSIGLEGRIGAVGGRRTRLPDGSERFVVNESMLIDWTGRLGGQLLDPIKTTNVQQQRCMTTWCLLKCR